MKPNMEKIIQVLISLIGEQEKVKIDYTLEKKAEDKTAQADKEVDKHGKREEKRVLKKTCESTQETLVI